MVDNSRAYEAWVNDRSLFSMTPAQQVTRETNRINSSWVLEEKIQALYAQAELQLFANRLRVLGGVRYEKTGYDGAGLLYQPEAVWQHNADGSFVRNPAGQRVRRPEAGAVNSLEQLFLTRIERGHHVNRAIDGFFPSLHLTYTVSKNVLLRAAYAKTYGRPNFQQIVPNTTINEFDDDTSSGRITTRNISLKPWRANNYDVSLEYYTEQGGILTAGFFRKEIFDFFGAIDTVATAADLESLGIDSQYVGWDLRTTINAGDATLDGVELDLRHSLQPLGQWGRDFSVFANAAKVKLKSDESREADFTDFRPLTVNWGFLFSRKPITLRARWHHR